MGRDLVVGLDQQTFSKEELMNLEITFRHMEHTDSIDQKIREKMEKFASKHLTPNANIQWTCLVEHHDHMASVHVKDKGHDFHVKASAESMYKTIDQVLTKLVSQVETQNHHPGL